MKELDNTIINAQTVNINSNQKNINNQDTKNTANDLKLFSAIAETILAIPILWWSLIIWMLWIPLFLMIILHVVTIVFINKANISGFKVWNIIWIIWNILWFIPVVWMLFHMTTAVILWIEYSKKNNY